MTSLFDGAAGVGILEERAQSADRNKTLLIAVDPQCARLLCTIPAGLPHKSERAISLAGSRPQLSDFRRSCSAPVSQPIVPRGLLGARRPKPTPASLLRDNTGCTSFSVPSTRIQFPEYAVSTVSSSLKVRLCSLLGKISLPLNRIILAFFSKASGSRTFCAVEMACLLWKRRTTPLDNQPDRYRAALAFCAIAS